MAQLKIAVQLASLRQPFKRALATAARLGATAVEIDARREIVPRELSATGLRELRNLLDELNLRVSAVSFMTRRGYDVQQELERRIAATKEAMKFAWDLRAAVVINHVGSIPADENAPEWRLLVEALTDLASHGHRVGARLAAQTGENGPADLSRLLRAVPDGGIGVNLDPGNLILHGFSPLETAETLGAHVLHVHARDAVRSGGGGRGMETQLGRGSADIPAILGALAQFDYRGYVTVAREHADNPELEIGQAIEYLKSI